MSGVNNLKGAKKEDLRALQAIWNAPVSEPEFEDKRMLMGENEKRIPSEFRCRESCACCKTKELLN